MALGTHLSNIDPFEQYFGPGRRFQFTVFEDSGDDPQRDTVELFHCGLHARGLITPLLIPTPPHRAKAVVRNYFPEQFLETRKKKFFFLLTPCDYNLEHFLLTRKSRTNIHAQATAVVRYSFHEPFLFLLQITFTFFQTMKNMEQMQHGIHGH